ncbi:hypothetical protein Pmani_030430 [Petrolisthes manimaculis]|uniref:Gamma-interferon-inducible lysosomal thiol reductase n=1 Tax=Petrolisthes manimaculis TaxID=1843537 RepID=A0AAE1TTL2_9EUCA|nr:hypothetical protein Pmani_030430 [Petrolisthes manimaculis]
MTSQFHNHHHQHLTPFSGAISPLYHHLPTLSHLSITFFQHFLTSIFLRCDATLFSSALHDLTVSTILQGQDTAPLVKTALYYESLCPYSIDYFVNQLYPTWTLLKEIMDVELYPFGNASFEPNGDGWTFTCQHGDGECHGNMIHACAQAKFNDINVEMDFVNCLLSASYPPNAGATCAAAVGQDWAPIDECVNSLEGQTLLHDVAIKQQQLDPSLYFVPWILIDDTFSEAQVEACQTDMLSVVCERYTGPVPGPCQVIKQPRHHHHRSRALRGVTKA